MPGAHERLVGHEVGGREAELAPARVAVQRPRRAAGSGSPSSRLASATLAGQHQPADVARGDDLAVDFEQRVHDGREARRRPRSSSRVALGACGRSGSSRRPTPRRAERADEHVVDELARRCARRTRRRRGSRSSPRRRATATSSALRSSVVSSRGVCCGATTDTGWGSNVSTLSAPAITSRWPRWTPSKVPTATLRALHGARRRAGA